jgi:hypothetical protein
MTSKSPFASFRSMKHPNLADAFSLENQARGASSGQSRTRLHPL